MGLDVGEHALVNTLMRLPKRSVPADSTMTDSIVGEFLDHSTVQNEMADLHSILDVDPIRVYYEHCYSNAGVFGPKISSSYELGDSKVEHVSFSTLGLITSVIFVLFLLLLARFLFPSLSSFDGFLTTVLIGLPIGLFSLIIYANWVSRKLGEKDFLVGSTASAYCYVDTNSGRSIRENLIH